MKELLSCIVVLLASAQPADVQSAAASPAMTNERVLEDLQLTVGFDVRHSRQQCGSEQPCVEIRITNAGADSIAIQRPVEPARRATVMLYASDGTLVTAKAAAISIHGQPKHELAEDEIASGKTLKWILGLPGIGMTALNPAERYTCYVGFRVTVRAKRAAWSEYRRVEAMLRATNVRAMD
jgi:hypothetical protein